MSKMSRFFALFLLSEEYYFGQRFMNMRLDAVNVPYASKSTRPRCQRTSRTIYWRVSHLSTSFTERLNSDKGVDYANYFPGHPDLDEPEFFIRTKGKVDPADLLKKLIGDIQGDFSGLKL